MKIKCYDKYHKQELFIILGEDYDDEMWYWRSSGPQGVVIKQNITFQAVEGDKDNCDPKRWSDLINFEIIKE